MLGLERGQVLDAGGVLALGIHGVGHQVGALPQRQALQAGLDQQGRQIALPGRPDRMQGRKMPKQLGWRQRARRAATRRCAGRG